MQVNILGEYGYDIAIRGFGYSFMDSAADPEEYYTPDMKVRIEKAALAHVGKGRGMDKWIRQVAVYLDLRAPRYWWSEFDTYKVGTVAQSTSTMHTLSRRGIVMEDLEPSTPVDMEYLAYFNRRREDKLGTELRQLKGMLPEGYLQRRVVSLNYAVLRCIIDQRKNHRLPEWHTFINEVYRGVQHPELLPILEKNLPKLGD